MDWGRRAVARAYAASASAYTGAFGDEFVTKEFDRVVVERFLDSVAPGSRVLDGGCGPGQFAVLAAEHGLVPLGVDVTFEMLSIAKERLVATGLVESGLVCADLCDLPFADAAFEGVACWFSVHNLPRDLLPHSLVEARRILTTGGQLLLATHEGAAEEFFTDEAGESFSFTYYAGEELAALLVDAGFTSVETTVRAPMAGEHQVPKLFASAIANA